MSASEQGQRQLEAKIFYYAGKVDAHVKRLRFDGFASVLRSNAAGAAARLTETIGSTTLDMEAARSVSSAYLDVHAELRQHLSGEGVEPSDFDSAYPGWAKWVHARFRSACSDAVLAVQPDAFLDRLHDDEVQKNFEDLYLDSGVRRMANMSVADVVRCLALSLLKRPHRPFSPVAAVIVAEGMLMQIFGREINVSLLKALKEQWGQILECTQGQVLHDHPPISAPIVDEAVLWLLDAIADEAQFVANRLSPEGCKHAVRERGKRFLGTDDRRVIETVAALYATGPRPLSELARRVGIGSHEEDRWSVTQLADLEDAGFLQFGLGDGFVGPVATPASVGMLLSRRHD